MYVLVVQTGLDLPLEIARDHLWRLQVEHAAGGEAAHQRLLDSTRIDTRTLGQQHRLGRAELIDDRADLIAGLCHLAGAARADMDDALGVDASTGLTRSTAAFDPPTMIASVPASAAALPPDTGASSISTPRVSSVAAIRRAPSGAIVL